MSKLKIAFKLKLQISLRAIGRVLLMPGYTLVAVLTIWLSLGLLVWISNLSLLWSIIAHSSLSFTDKINFFLDGYKSLFSNFEPMAGTTILIFAILFGINIGLLAFVVKASVKSAASDGSRGVIGILAGIVGAGCAACGTSFLAPVISGVGATATIGLTTFLGYAANLLGIGLLLFSIYRLGLNASATPPKTSTNW